MNDNLKRKYCPLNCSQNTWVSSAMFKRSSCVACVTEDFLNGLPTKDVFFLFGTFSHHEIMQPHISLSSCCRSLFVSVSVCRLPDASFSYSKSLSQIQNPHSRLYRLSLRFISFITGAVLPKFQIYHRMGCWSWEFSKWKKSSSFKYKISFITLHWWECGQIELMGM
jgi:hypothetical protein